jgi:MFS family permease
MHPNAQRGYVLAVLTLAYALNIADRFSIATLIEPIRRELQLSDSGIGFLTGVAQALFYVTIGIPVALYADRANRRNILVVALALWSGMTALCGLASNYSQLLLARFGVGIGEAGGTPPSTSILADTFPALRPSWQILFRPRNVQWRSRSLRSAPALVPGSDPRSRAGSHNMAAGISPSWCWEYLAWCLPCWFAARSRNRSGDGSMKLHRRRPRPLSLKLLRTSYTTGAHSIYCSAGR